MQTKDYYQIGIVTEKPNNCLENRLTLALNKPTRITKVVKQISQQVSDIFEKFLMLD